MTRSLLKCAATYADLRSTSSLAAVLAQGETGPDYSVTALTDENGFLGVDGIFRFLNDRTNERGLAIAEVRNKQVYIIDPAPRFFRF